MPAASQTSSFTRAAAIRSLAVPVLLWAIIAVGGLFVGSTGFGVGGWSDRLESVLLASLVGASLGAAGCVFQAVLRNPLADPYLLGVSSGAALASYLYFSPMWLTGMAATVAGVLGPTLLALTGALLTVVVAVSFSMRHGRPDPLSLVLTGTVITSFLSAVFVLLTTLRPELTAASGGSMRFLIGAFQLPMAGWQWAVATGLAAAGWLACGSVVPAMNVAQVSDAEATALGVRIGRLRLIAIAGAAIMTAAAVSVSGPIGFVGIMCPHVARLLVGGDYRRLYPAATAAGAILLVLSDGLCRTLAQDQFLQRLLPVGVVTAMLGVPFFLLLLRRARRAEEV